MNDTATPEQFTVSTDMSNVISYDQFKLIVDRDISEVVALEANNDFELAGVVLESLDRFGSKFREHTAQYAGEIALLRRDVAA